SYYRSINAADLYENIKAYTVLDVREPFELIFGSIANSINIPISELREKWKILERDKKYAVICAHGNRSAAAVEFLSQLGLNIVDVEGGIQSWIEEGYPVVLEHHHHHH
uniref:Uncharacterized rhodanese-related protein TVG0868615 n=1 Tax=Thermoplasma volcanium (strain ATCC 51530 / DSM 4299 / JCM 9571 / NBRC 15438 / GSS1) TaxID=273116 RepID=UPI0001986809|nr:Chain A, Uncharacterized rhodanese-related protein TVG0868615 [Thermoplasma volcanium GSS1]